jgi:hypothetical protein
VVGKPQEEVKHASCLIKDDFSAAIEKAAPQLIHLLGDPDPGVRLAVVNAMNILAQNGVWATRDT